MTGIPVAGGTLPCPYPVEVVSGGEGSSGGLTNEELRASAVPVSISGTVPVSGSLTDAQLRASAVPVSLSSVPSHAVTGPLTDAQLRASTVPISGTVTANAGSGTFAVSGPLTDAQLRASAVPVSIAATITAQRATDQARAIVNAATAIAGVQAVSSEAMLTLAVSRNGAATSNVTSISVTSGKKLRILGINAGVISTAAAVISCRVALRMNPSGAVTTSSPVIAILPMSQQATAIAQAGNEQAIMFPEAIEVSGTMQIGLSHLANATTGTVWASLIAYEY